MLVQLIYWLVLLELVSVASFPIAYRAFTHLPDRGYALSKPAGLLLVSTAAWLIGFSHFVPNSRWSVLFALALVVGFSWLAMRGRAHELRQFLRQGIRTVIATELVFIGVFLAIAMLRAATPDIAHTEQPMDFMFLNAVISSPSFPPQDPWLAGESVSYYYFGYLMIGVITLLSGLGAAITYNLGLATIAALAAVAIYGIVFDLVQVSRGTKAGAVAAGVGGAFLLVFASNLEGTLELAKAAGAGGASFWESVGIQGLVVPATPSLGWVPDDTAWWWWRASRVIPGTINEFPMFSFILGDLHPHVMSMPFLLLVIGVAIQLYLSPRLLERVPEGWVWLPVIPGATALVSLAAGLVVFVYWPGDLPGWVQTLIVVGIIVVLAILWVASVVATLIATGIAGPRLVAAVGWPLALLSIVSLGAMAAINLWDLPLSLTLVGGAVMLNAARYGRELRFRLGRAVMAGLVLTAAGVLSFGLFYLTFESTGDGALPLRGLVSRPFHLLLIWGAVGVLAASLAVVALPRVVAAAGNRAMRLGVASFIGLAPVFVWFQIGSRMLAVALFLMFLLAAIFALRRAGYRLLAADEANFAGTGTGLTLMAIAGVVFLILVWNGLYHGERIAGSESTSFERMLVVIPLALVVIFALYSVWSLADQGNQPGDSRWNGLVPALAFLGIAALLIMGAELFYITDFFGGGLRRMNTVFKFYYQAWLLLSVTGGYALWYVTSRWNRRVLAGRVGITVWSILLVVGLGAISYYPAAAFVTRADWAGPLSLDGQRHVAESAPAEFDAIQWIRANVPSEAVVVEAAEVPCSDASGACSDWTQVGRIAGSTGRPTIIGWEQHELQWRKNDAIVYGRKADVRTIYQTLDLGIAEEFLKQYEADYLIVGHRERWAYGTEGMAKFAQLGIPIYKNSEVTIYQLIFETNNS